MKKLDLGQTITILANIGVITGIVFLALELRQNNEFLGAQARAVRLDSRQSDTRLILENPDLAHAVLKAEQRQPLSDYEKRLMDGYWNYRLVNFQAVYREMSLGLIDPATIPVEAWRIGFARVPDEYMNLRAYWERHRDSEFDPDFVLWMEENVVPE